jgi:amino acid permease
MSLAAQVVWLLVLAVPVACIAWTFTQEEVLRELRAYAEQQRDHAPQLWKRKFYYLLTCHYCFSHYVAIFFLGLTRFKLLYLDWRGYIIALFALVWVANQYMSVYALLRQDLKKERFVAKAVEHKVKEEIEPKVELHKPAA